MNIWTKVRVELVCLCLSWKVSTLLYLYSTTQCVLQSYCRVQMESMALVQHVSPLPGSGLSVTADLHWGQQHPLNPRRHHNFYNNSIIPPSTAFSLSNVLRQYALRNSRYLFWYYLKITIEHSSLTFIFRIFE